MREDVPAMFVTRTLLKLAGHPRKRNDVEDNVAGMRARTTLRGGGEDFTCPV